MDFQLMICVVLLAGALFWLGNRFYKQLNSNKSCSSGCGKCSASENMVKQMEKGLDQSL